MSNAKRKARKRMRRESNFPKSDVHTDRQHIYYGANFLPYQHPRREGIPYGRSKPWSIGREIADMHRQMDTTRAIVEAAPDIWRGMVGR